MNQVFGGTTEHRSTHKTSLNAAQRMIMEYQPASMAQSRQIHVAGPRPLSNPPPPVPLAAASAPAAALTVTRNADTYPLLSVEQVKALPDPSWLIDDVLLTGSLASIYGKPGLGKTFVILDMSLSIASGLPWHGQQVRQGPVVYIAAEGALGLKKRLMAWRSTHPHGDTDAFFVLPEAVPMLDRQAVARVSKTLETKALQPALIVVDTLSRCIAGHDESGSKDMSALVQVVDVLRATTGTAVLVVHHPGKDGKTERGSSALEGAADTRMHLDGRGDDEFELRCLKQKEAAPFDGWRLRRVEKTTTYGTSCVVETVGRLCAEPPGSSQAAIRQAIIRFLEDCPEPVTQTAVEHAVTGKRTIVSEELKAAAADPACPVAGIKGPRGVRYWLGEPTAAEDVDQLL